MELCVRQKVQNKVREDLDLLAVLVVALMVSCSVLPPVREAVTVIEYSVPSSRPVSVYIVWLAAIPEMVLE